MEFIHQRVTHERGQKLARGEFAQDLDQLSVAEEVDHTEREDHLSSPEDESMMQLGVSQIMLSHLRL